MTSLTPPKKTSIASNSRSPYPTTAAKTPIKSNNASPNNHAFGNMREIPLDPKATYTISYLPGINEQAIDTGKTLDESRMKVVLLTCELERINTYNYSLVRENEVLRVQANKSEREKDLETKLAIVLAENEKLNQVIEDVYEAYMDQKGFGGAGNEEYERRLANLYEDLEDWKHKYNVLESQNNVVELQNTVKDLQNQRDLLSEQLSRKDRDLEAIRARLTSLEGTHVQEIVSTKQDQSKNLAALTAENDSLRRENDAIRLQYGKADTLNLRLADYDNKIRTVLNENEKLNDLVLSKVNEVNELKAQLERERHNNVTVSEFNAVISGNEHRKKAAIGPVLGGSPTVAKNGSPSSTHDFGYESRVVTFDAKNSSPNAGNKSSPNYGDTTNFELSSKIQDLSKDNDSLRNENYALKTKLEHAIDSETKLSMTITENQRLSYQLAEKERDLNRFLNDLKSGQDNKNAVERLTVKLNELLVENEKLNRAVENKSRDHGWADEENRRLAEQLEQKKREINDLYGRFNEANQSTFVVNELKEKLIIVSTENERLHTQISVRADEIDGLRRKVAALESRPTTDPSAEERIRLLLSENQRLANQVREQGAELDNLRSRLHADDAKVYQIETLQSKITMVVNENERLGRELDTLRAKLRDDKTIELNSQINYISQEKQRLEAVLDDKNRELSRLNNDLINARGELSHIKDNHLRVVENNANELNKHNEHLKKAAYNQQNKIDELEGRLGQVFALETKVNQFNLEIEKLHRDSSERENHIQNLTQRLSEKDRENEDIRRRLLAFDNSKQKELDDLKYRILGENEQKNNSLRNDFENQLRRLSNDKQNAEERVGRISIEAEKLNHLASDLKNELEIWKKRSNDLERERGGNLAEIEELRGQFEKLKHMNIQVKEMQQKFSAERTAYETQILQLNQALEDMEHRNHHLLQENQRLNEIARQSQQIIDELRGQINDESHKLEVYELKSHLEVLKSNTYDVKQLSVQYNAERAADQARIAELGGLVETYKNECAKLSEIIEMRKHDVENLARQNEELRIMCKQSRASFSPEKSKQIDYLQAKVYELETSRDELQKIADRHAVELTRKNRELVDKIQELDILKLRYEEAYANYQALNTQLFTRYSHQN